MSGRSKWRSRNEVFLSESSRTWAVWRIWKAIFATCWGACSKGKKRSVDESAGSLKHLTQEEAQKLIDMDDVVREAMAKVEQAGIVFLDEIDKIAGRERTAGPDVSREGVQRDLLPIVEGCTVRRSMGRW